MKTLNKLTVAILAASISIGAFAQQRARSDSSHSSQSSSASTTAGMDEKVNLAMIIAKANMALLKQAYGLNFRQVEDLSNGLWRTFPTPAAGLIDHTSNAGALWRTVGIANLDEAKSGSANIQQIIGAAQRGELESKFFPLVMLSAGFEAIRPVGIVLDCGIYWSVVDAVKISSAMYSEIAKRIKRNYKSADAVRDGVMQIIPTLDAKKIVETAVADNGSDISCLMSDVNSHRITSGPMIFSHRATGWEIQGQRGNLFGSGAIDGANIEVSVGNHSDTKTDSGRTQDAKRGESSGSRTRSY